MTGEEIHALIRAQQGLVSRNGDVFVTEPYGDSLHGVDPTVLDRMFARLHDDGLIDVDGALTPLGLNRLLGRA